MKAITLALAALLTTSAIAHAADPIAERKHVFEQYKKTVGPMGKMLKGDTPYNKEEFSKLAAHLEALSQLPWQHFPAGSDKGKTDAKPEIWSQPDKFKAAVDKHKAEVGKLKTVAASGDLAAIKAQFGATQQTCKACHDNFRKD